MKTLTERLAEMDAMLMPYAVKHAAGLGRQSEEQEDESRFRFQRDRDRIVHTQAFRRLKGKTQVFVGGGGDHYRTRLTHTLEVAGISRDIARTLGVNEDLAECIAIAHDLGHPPFGHAGEATLNRWMNQHGSQFEHNVQSHRIVTVLERHAKTGAGLNLNQEILDGLLKHSTPHDHPNGAQKIDRSPTVEAQIVNIADEISYTAHDTEDGLNAELYSLKDLSRIPLVKAAMELYEPRGTSLRGALIHLMVTDLYENTKVLVSSYCITTLESVYSAREPVVQFSESMQKKLGILRTFLWDSMYNHPMVLSRSSAGQEIIEALCSQYLTEKNSKVLEIQAMTGSSLPIAIKDYIAGMTDGYAYLQAKEAGLLDEETLEALQ